MLFCIYLNDLPTAKTFCKLESYVDDSKLFMPFPLVELDAAIEKLKQNLHSVAQWCCENHFLGTRQMLSRLPEDPRVVFLSKTLKPTDSTKDLRVFLDPHLTYDHHISWKGNTRVVNNVISL